MRANVRPLLAFLTRLFHTFADSDRIAEYDMKLMDIDADTLGIPETDYEARVTMPSAEFSRIVRDLSQLGESVRIEVSKEGVRFASDGEAANGSVLLKPTGGAGVTRMKEEPKEEPRDAEEDAEEDEDGVKVKEEKKPAKVKKEAGSDDDVEMDDDEDTKEAQPDSDGEDEASDDEGNKKRKKKVLHISLYRVSSQLMPNTKQNAADKPSKRVKTASGSKGKGKKKVDDEEAGLVLVEMNQHVSLTFSLKYLVNFSKSGSLSNVVKLMMSNDVPLLVRTLFDLWTMQLTDSLFRSHTSSVKGISTTIWLPKLGTSDSLNNLLVRLVFPLSKISCNPTNVHDLSCPPQPQCDMLHERNN